MIQHWMDALHLRIPGAHVMLVATHADAVPPDLLDSLCADVRQAVQDRLATLDAASAADSRAPPLCVHAGGESARVDCLSGDGVAEFRAALLRFSAGVPWHREALPASWVRTRAAVLALAAARPFVDWAEYAALAEREGLRPPLLASCTRFLHDTGALRFFGRPDAAAAAGGGAGGRGGVLEGTVFVSPEWMASVMKGLVRHDRDALLDHFARAGDRRMFRRVQRLMVHGRLRRELLPFLWPRSPAGAAYWDGPSVRQSAEAAVWGGAEVVRCAEDLARAVGLLEGFDLLLLREADGEYIVPGVLRGGRRGGLPLDAFDGAACPFAARFAYAAALPAGAFDSLVVRLARLTAEVHYGPGAAVFYRLGHMCQLFCSPDPATGRTVLTIRCRRRATPPSPLPIIPPRPGGYLAQDGSVYGRGKVGGGGGADRLLLTGCC
jgi:hypothetical protein